MSKKKLKYLDCEVYTVEIGEDGNKLIHVDGYCYLNEDGYQCVEACGCYIDIDDFNGDVRMVFDEFDQCKQYQGTLTRKEVREYYKDATELLIEKVTKDTPLGTYVNYGS